MGVMCRSRQIVQVLARVQAQVPEQVPLEVRWVLRDCCQSARHTH